MLRRMNILESPGARREESLGFLGDVHRMVIEDDTNIRLAGIVGDSGR